MSAKAVASVCKEYRVEKGMERERETGPPIDTRICFFWQLHWLNQRWQELEEPATDTVS